MNYRTRTDPPEPIEAVQFVRQPIEGFERQRIGTDHEGLVIYEAIKDLNPGHQIIYSGYWLVNGTWLSPEEFDALYEKAPEPIPEPVAEPEPEASAEEPPVVEVPPTPPAEEVQVLSIAPSALHVDQGPWNPAPVPEPEPLPPVAEPIVDATATPEVPLADSDAPAAGDPDDVQAEAVAADAAPVESTTHEGE